MATPFLAVNRTLYILPHALYERTKTSARIGATRQYARQQHNQNYQPF